MKRFSIFTHPLPPEDGMRYKIEESNGRYRIYDSKFDNVTIARTGSKARALYLALDLSKRFGDAPRPIALEEYQKRQEAA